MVAIGAAVHATAMWDCIQLLLSDSPLLLARRHLLAQLIVVAACSVARHVIIRHCVAAGVAAVRRREEGAGTTFGADSFVLGAEESVILSIMGTGCSSGDSGHMR